MKDYYNTFKAILKENTKFKPSFLILECPRFIANIFLTKQG